MSCKRAGVPACLTALALFAAGAPVAAAPRSGKDHDLAKAAVVDRVILAVIENYYDPERISPREMFDSVTGMLERKVAEFEFRRHGERAAQVALGGRILDLDLAELDSPWELSRLLRRLLGFLERNLPAGEYDEVDLEYDVANAVLATLDPHSSAMSPDVYEDLRMGTVGEFGGLGIKITTDRRPPCGGVLTVVEVFPHTPAQRAGFKVGDRILRIDGESTINITTGEAANRLRGKPGTGVELELERADGTRRKVGVTRQRIPIESVTWKLLDGGVGYVELEAFQGNSAMEFAGALRALHAKGMKGLILDLRGNPGGLLDMAIKVADQFLDSGTIVATAGRPEDEREVSNASPEGTEPRYPMVVLIDFVSASAAEIIAGALRNHGRALLAGETTFGKGSVQLVMPLPAGGALRLTSAQYLTPGDISIQTVGVAPDVRFLPVVVDKEQLELEWRGRVFSEADLDKHLERPSARGRGDRDGAAEALLFVPAAEREKDRQRFDRCYADDPDRQGWKARYEVEFARRLVAGARGETAEGLLIDARDLVARDRVEEDLKLVRAFGKLGVDWSAPGVASPAADPGSAPEPRVVPEVTVKMALTGKAEPGSKLGIKVTVHNGSDRPIHRLRAVTRSENQVFEGRELAFGLVAPGRSRAWTAIVELPPVMAARIDPVTLDFRSADGRIPGGASIDVRIPGRSEPRLAFAWHLEDLGNGNGFIEPGEEILAHVRVSNLGEGATFDSEANLSARPGVDIIEGRFHIGRLEPGASREGRFRFRVAGRFEGTVAEIRLSIDDWVRSRFPTTLTLLDTTFDIDVSPVKPGPSSAAGHVTLVDGGPDVPLLAAPDPRGATVATARPGTAFPVDGRHRGFFRLLLGEQRHAWVAEERVRAGGEGRGAFQPIPIEPPLIDVEGDSVRITGAATIAVKGRVRHPRSVRDLIVFVGNRKVAYVANPSGGNPAELAFDLVLPLEEGANPIGLVARHDSKVVSTRAMFVRRSSPAAPGSGKSGK